MDSINQQQVEDNFDDLRGTKAAAKIRDLAEDAKTCFFCTSSATGESIGTRPMTVQKVDDEGCLWFLSADDSHMNHEIDKDPHVKLYFQGSKHAGFMHLTGTASISTDRSKIEEFWNPLFKTWFTEGIEDPRITVIKVTPKDGYYWDTKHGHAVAFIKIMVGAMMGKTMDDSVEGKITA